MGTRMDKKKKRKKGLTQKRQSPIRTLGDMGNVKTGEMQADRRSDES